MREENGDGRKILRNAALVLAGRPSLRDRQLLTLSSDSPFKVTERGVLTPAMMGKNGDQIPRLFKRPATLYVLQYWDQVAESIYDAMKTYATVRSISGVGEKTYYAVVDDADSARILAAYPHAFR